MGRKYEIQVGGQVFVVSSEKGEAHVRMLADMVERRRQEIASKGKTADSARLALMTALTLAEELSEKKSNTDEVEAREENDGSPALGSPVSFYLGPSV